MSVTAMKTGATLPIVMSDKGKPPPPSQKQIVKKIPFFLDVIVKSHIGYAHFPTTNPSAMEEVEEDTPVVFSSVSGIQSEC